MTMEQKFGGENRMNPEYKQLLEKYRSRGELLEDKFLESINTTTAKVFDYLDVSSWQELQEKLSDPTKLPLGVIADFIFDGDKMIRVIARSHDAKRLYLSDIYSWNYGEESDEYEEDIPPQIQESIDHSYIPDHNRSQIVAVVSESEGIAMPYYTDRNPHMVLWVTSESRGKGLGYALYRLHEELFGARKSELAPSLSLLKAYMTLGFKPKSVVNPIDGSIMGLDPEEGVMDAFTSGEDSLDFPIYLERQ